LERAVLLLEPPRAAVLALVVAPDAVIRLIESAGEVGSLVGQRKAVAAPPFVFGQPQHRHPVALDGLDRHQMMHVEAMRDFEQNAVAMLAAPSGRQCRPGGIALRDLDRARISGLAIEPIRDMLGIAPLPGGDRLTALSIQYTIKLAGQPGSVNRHGIVFFDPFDGAALNKEAL